MAGPVITLSEARAKDGVPFLSLDRAGGHAGDGEPRLAQQPKEVVMHVASFCDSETELALAGASKRIHTQLLGPLHESYREALPTTREYMNCVLRMDMITLRMRDRQQRIPVAGQNTRNANYTEQRNDEDEFEKLEHQKNKLQKAVNEVLLLQLRQGMHPLSAALLGGIKAALQEKTLAGQVKVYGTSIRAAILRSPLALHPESYVNDLDGFADMGMAPDFEDKLKQMEATVEDGMREGACIAVSHWADMQLAAPVREAQDLIHHDLPD